MTTYQIITTTRAGIEYGPEFAVEDAIANLIDNNLDYFIDKLLEENPEQPGYILTVWGTGYKFADFRNEGE